jgi:epoxyqueuosine reductase QueG
MEYPYISDAYNEILLDKTINLAKEKLNIQLRKLEALLIKEHINYLIINEGQDETTLLGLFPHKTVAVQSGLGWIGRNSLLITEEYGPRVRIATVLLGIESNHENILMENKCGECTKCLTACPYNCIIGRSWYEGISRDKMIDAFKCSKIREGFTDKIGHKHACGYCLLVCPYGDQ